MGSSHRVVSCVFSWTGSIMRLLQQSIWNWRIRLLCAICLSLIGLLISCQSLPVQISRPQNQPPQIEPLPVIAVANAPTPPHVVHLPPPATSTQPALNTPLALNTPAAGAPLSEIGLPTPTLPPTETPSDLAATLLLLPSPTPTIKIAELLEQPVSEPPAVSEPVQPDAAPTDTFALADTLAPTETMVPTETQIPTETPLPTDTPPPSPLLFASDLVNDGVVRTAKVPILMYHYLSVPPANADIYRKDLSVAPDLFNAHLDRLQAEGYTTISFYELVAYLTQGALLPEKPVILTFDDGYRDNYENAFAALKSHGMRATFFVVIDFINKGRPEYVTWDMLREMHKAGMSVEAHSLEHSSLKKRSRDDLLFQALRCYETLQNELGQRARFISYPAGQYDATTIDAFREAGYWAGITTVQGATHTTDHLFELKRVRIRGTTSPDELVKLLATDW